jgi:hypothetical protein
MSFGKELLLNVMDDFPAKLINMRSQRSGWGREPYVRKGTAQRAISVPSWTGNDQANADSAFAEEKYIRKGPNRNGRAAG